MSVVVIVVVVVVVVAAAAAVIVVGRHYSCTVLLSNTRALMNKLNELLGVLNCNAVDAAVITETRLSANIPQTCSDILGYTAYHRTRVNRKGEVAV